MHGLEELTERMGWWFGICACGWESPASPDREIAAEFWADHRWQSLSPRTPCHHTLLLVAGEPVQTFVCELPDGHAIDHEDEENRQWPRRTCDTDLHEIMRTVVRIEGDGPDRDLCADCAGRLFLHAQTRWREAKAAG